MNGPGIRTRQNMPAAYQECERITRQQAGNFSYGITLLPPPKRAALSAVYAFARRIDDIGDAPPEELSQEEKLAGLDEADKRLGELDRCPDDPVLTALSDAAVRYELPLDAFSELIEGCRADVLGTGYETYEQLRHYCRCVAGSIGRLSLAVFGSRGPARDTELADNLGIALQLTNILRDILEDRHTGRVYLPAAELRRFGVTLELDSFGRFVDSEDRLLSLVEYQAARAEEYYTTGLRLLADLDGRSRACCAAMAGIYHRLLRRIALRPATVLTERASLPNREKVTVAVRCLTGAGV